MHKDFQIYHFPGVSRSSGGLLIMVRRLLWQGKFNTTPIYMQNGRLAGLHIFVHNFRVNVYNIHNKDLTLSSVKRLIRMVNRDTSSNTLPPTTTKPLFLWATLILTHLVI